MTFQTKVMIVLVIILVGLCSLIGFLYNKLDALENQKNQLTQNLQATRDSANVLAAKVTTTTVFVRELEDSLKFVKAKNIALESKIKILIKNSSGHGPAVIASTKDTDFVVVTFTDSYSIVKVDGMTSANMKTNSATFDISYSFSPINIRSWLFKDSADDLWKIQTQSEDSTIFVKGISTIDPETFEALQEYKPISAVRNTFLLGAYANHDFFAAGIGLRVNDWIVSPQYRLTDSSNLWWQNINIGLFYFLF